MSDILLFNPPAPGGQGYTREGRCTQEAGVWGTQWPPLTLATAAALLRRDGHRVTLRDYPATGAGLLSLTDDLRTLRPGFAIWSTGTPTLSSDLDIARVVRGNSPASVTAVIGTHVTVRPEEALCEPALKIVVRGEPEGIIRELCRCAGALADVPGISWRDDDGAIRHNPDAPWLDPDTIPAPDWDGLDCDAYRLPLKGRRFLIAAPVRGCPYRCAFCTAPLYYGSRLRRRPVAQVVDEMAGSISRYGIREFFIWADTFTADRRYVQELCRFILAKGLRISWTCNSRVDTIDEETLRLMKQAGLWMISFGLESGNDAILAASGKGITAAQSCEAVLMADSLGIRTAGHFMFGLPGETEETMAQTLTLALSLPLDIAQFYAATPFPGTALYDDALREGWLNGAGKGGAFAQNSAVMELPGLPAARVDAFRREAYRRFYLRPRAAARVLSMTEPGALAGMAPLLRRFLRWMR
ncbi:MAG: radical SAM protein [Deltaproteobacteria bacterium]|nr:radical SAM protein [Deltaproteobacteria bacterium]